MYSFIKGFLTRNDLPNAYNRQFVVYKQTRYLIRLSETLPKSLMDDHWPEPPSCCKEVNEIKYHVEGNVFFYFCIHHGSVDDIRFLRTGIRPFEDAAPYLVVTNVPIEFDGMSRVV